MALERFTNACAAAKARRQVIGMEQGHWTNNAKSHGISMASHLSIVPRTGGYGFKLPVLAIWK